MATTMRVRTRYGKTISARKPKVYACVKRGRVYYSKAQPTGCTIHTVGYGRTTRQARAQAKKRIAKMR